MKHPRPRALRVLFQQICILSTGHVATAGWTCRGVALKPEAIAVI